MSDYTYDPVGGLFREGMGPSVGRVADLKTYRLRDMVPAGPASAVLEMYLGEASRTLKQLNAIRDEVRAARPSQLRSELCKILHITI